ncbi:hypothetical protein [Streptomyces demainii]|uniref:Uncharacterized protein n=1 Tax=Streptomyces demainii TaxID=588122 RepID=A0ABT9KJH6_9ACTN|nr:hypothetical protein [Streptomyces demainii]MDP9608330.1 hypothetical protein [Streptomyces demainii]
MESRAGSLELVGGVRAGVGGEVGVVGPRMVPDGEAVGEAGAATAEERDSQVIGVW